MSKDINRILIETAVKRALRDMDEAPERAARNLVDLGMNFSGGRFQKRFLGTAREMLRNEDSAYYQVIRDIITHVDREILLDFGINLGYNSCTKGAEAIRSLEAQKGFNIPWSLSLALDEECLEKRKEIYASILKQGTSLGIYTYLLFFHEGNPMKLSGLIKENRDCAFVIFLRGGKITEAYVNGTRGAKNVMTAVYEDHDAQEACKRLRQAGLLYGIYRIYSEEDKESILDGRWLSGIRKALPYFAFLLPDDNCTSKTCEQVYAYVLSVRTGHRHPVILLDLKRDSMEIDGIISDGVCMAGFDRAGRLRTSGGIQDREEYNIFKNSLESILQMTMKK